MRRFPRQGPIGVELVQLFEQGLLSLFQRCDLLGRGLFAFRDELPWPLLPRHAVVAAQDPAASCFDTPQGSLVSMLV